MLFTVFSQVYTLCDGHHSISQNSAINALYKEWILDTEVICIVTYHLVLPSPYQHLWIHDEHLILPFPYFGLDILIFLKMKLDLCVISKKSVSAESFV
jgi:hypothetical protein